MCRGKGVNVLGLDCAYKFKVGGGKCIGLMLCCRNIAILRLRSECHYEEGSDEVIF